MPKMWRAIRAAGARLYGGSVSGLSESGPRTVAVRICGEFRWDSEIEPRLGETGAKKQQECPRPKNRPR